MQFSLFLNIILSAKHCPRDPLFDCIRLLHLYIIFILQLFVYDLCTLFTRKTTNQPIAASAVRADKYNYRNWNFVKATIHRVHLSVSATEEIEQGVKSRHQSDFTDVFLVFLLLTWNRLHISVDICKLLYSPTVLWYIQKSSGKWRTAVFC